MDAGESNDSVTFMGQKYDSLSDLLFDIGTRHRVIQAYARDTEAETQADLASIEDDILEWFHRKYGHNFK